VDPSFISDPSDLGCLLLDFRFPIKTLISLLFKWSATTKKKPNKTNLPVLLKQKTELFYPAETRVLNPGPDFYVTKETEQNKTPSSPQTKTELFYPAETWVLNPGPESGFLSNNSNYSRS
jgi:hypothetical protein